MNQRSTTARAAGATGLTLALACLLSAPHAHANTYFKCVDAKGSVTVQQTACATTSSQEEKKVWAQGTQATPAAAQPLGERTPPAPRRAEDAARPKDR